MNPEYWAVSVDDLAEAVWELRSDVGGAHYFGFEATEAEAKEKAMQEFGKLWDRLAYRANSYGSKWTEEDEASDE